MGEETKKTTEGSTNDQNTAEGGTALGGDAGNESAAGADAGGGTALGGEGGTENNEGGTASGGEGNDSGNNDTGGAPESYEDFNVPEGVNLNEDAIKDFSALAKESNLSQDAAQKMVDIVAESMKGMEQSIDDSYKNTVDNWLKDAKTDTDIGGANFKENVDIAKTAIEKFFGSEASNLLNETGLGNNKIFIKGFYKIGKLISEDAINDGGAGGGTGEKGNIANSIFNKTRK